MQATNPLEGTRKANLKVKGKLISASLELWLCNTGRLFVQFGLERRVRECSAAELLPGVQKTTRSTLARRRKFLIAKSCLLVHK